MNHKEQATTAMIGIENIPRPTLAGITGILCDIDGTITCAGRLPAASYSALWRLHEAGLKLVPVTGRSAGWCDHIARFWPVDAVIGENGGFYFHHDGRRLNRRFVETEPVRRDHRRRLDAVCMKILNDVPGCAVASDQPYRECDLAIDYCEDVAPLPSDADRRICDVFEAAGARASVSSIHVNGWFGSHDKLSTTRLCVGELFGIDPAADNDSFVFCGDSPNDEPMFAFFRLGIGMANIARFKDVLVHAPAYVATRDHDAGFREVVDLVLAARTG